MSRETVGDEVRSGDLTVEGTVAADSATVSGTVGIGTSSPGAALEVAASSPIIRLRDSDIGSTIYSHLSGSGGNGSLTLASDVNNATANSAISMQVDGSEKMRVDSAGLITGSGTSLGAWTAYTPTLGGTGWAIGNGTATGRYCQIGKIVLFKGMVTFGSTSTYGASRPEISFPNTLASSNYKGSIGVVARDVSASANYELAGIPLSTSLFILNVKGASGALSAVSSSAPFTWAASDTIEFYGTYEAA